MSAQRRTTLVMLSGARVDLLAPDWTEIRLSDIAYGLAAIRRWNGQARRHINDVEHSLRVEGLVGLVAPRLRLPALLHDAQEYAFGDWIRPAVNALIIKAPAAATAIDDIKFRLDVAICRSVLSQLGPDSYDVTEEYEAIKLAQEMRSPEVKQADDLAADLEDRGRGVFGCIDPIELRSELADDFSAAVAWMGSVRNACATRYGRGAGA